MRKLILALAGAFLLAGTAAADDANGAGVGAQSGRKDDFEIDQKLSLDERYEAAVGLESKGVRFTRVEIRNVPNKAELESAGKLSSSRPVPVVFVENGSGSKVRVFVEVALEDEQGAAIQSCKRSTNFDPGESDDMSACMAVPIYTRDWPRVKVFHLRASVVPKH